MKQIECLPLGRHVHAPLPSSPAARYDTRACMQGVLAKRASVQQGTGLQVDAQAAGTGGDEEHLDLQGQGDKLGAAAFDVLLALLEPAPSRILLQAVHSISVCRLRQHGGLESNTVRRAHTLQSSALKLSIMACRCQLLVLPSSRK